MIQAIKDWLKDWKQRLIDWKDMLWNLSSSYFEYIILLFQTNKEGMSWKDFKGELKTIAGMRQMPGRRRRR
jgi:hypothetical protein